MIPTERKPDYINDDGFKWWIESDLLKYCKLKGLDIFIPYIVEAPDKSKKRVLVNDERNKVEYECTSIEDMATHIDMLSLSQRKWK